MHLISMIQWTSPLHEIARLSLHNWFKGVFSFIFFGFSFQLLVITMWGIFYLGERVHTPDP